VVPVFIGKAVDRDGRKDSECCRDEDVSHVGRQNFARGESLEGGGRLDVIRSESYHDEDRDAAKELKSISGSNK